MLTAIRTVSRVTAALGIVLGTLMPTITAAADPTPDPAEPYVVSRIAVIPSAAAHPPARAPGR